MDVFTLLISTFRMPKASVVRLLLPYEKGGVHVQEYAFPFLFVWACVLVPADPFRSGMLTLLNCSNEKKMVEDGLLTKGIVNFTYFFLLRGLSIVINGHL